MQNTPKLPMNVHMPCIFPVGLLDNEAEVQAMGRKGADPLLPLDQAETNAPKKI